MPGLGQRLLGAALVGTGQGILHQAKTKREDTLLNLRRKWQVEDREAGQDFTREGWGRQDTRAAAAREHSAAMTREGWDRADARAQTAAERADARAEASQPLIPVVGDDGVTRYVPRSEAAGGRVPGKPKGTEPLQEIVGPDGNPVLVPRSQAVGKTPYKSTGKPERLYEEMDPATGLPTGRHLTREQALAKGSEMDTRARAAEVDAAVEDAGSWWPEWLGGKRDPSDEEVTRAYTIARDNPRMTGKEALMRAMGMGGRGDEPGQGGEDMPTGSGTDADPYDVTTQAHADWLKKNARPGTTYRHNGKTYRVK